MNITDFRHLAGLEHLITPRVRDLAGRELARTATRRELIDAGAQRSTAGLGGLLPLARALDLTVAEIQRLSGYSRQGLYNLLNEDPTAAFAVADTERIARLLTIAIVATGQETRLDQLGKALNAEFAALLPAARLLREHSLATLAEKRDAAATTLTPTPMASEWLRLDASSRELDDRRSGFGVYLRVRDEDVGPIDAVARDIVGLDEAVLIPVRTAPSIMSGPELALNVRATDQRAALRGAEAVWDEIKQRTGIEAPMTVTALLPPPTAPNAPSEVLDAFLAALAAGQDDDTADDLRAARERWDGGESERALAGRCLSWGARELRRALGREDADRLPVLRDGEDAFGEWVIVSSQLSLEPAQVAIQKPLKQALALAGERLGPYRGGELGSFKRPDGVPNVPRDVTPSPAELVEMATLAGQAVAAGKGGRAHLLRVLRLVIHPEGGGA